MQENTENPMAIGNCLPLFHFGAKSGTDDSKSNEIKATIRISPAKTRLQAKYSVNCLHWEKRSASMRGKPSWTLIA